jgi:proton-dependent oligopeptide transporter, POT family
MPESKAFLGQPRPFYLIFFLEFWERFGFYGVQAIIVLYMVQHMGFSDGRANLLFTAFNGLAFLLMALGGYIGDRLLGTKRTILLGAVTLAIGYFLLSLPYDTEPMLVLPLAVIAVGNGIFKANPSSLLSKIYHGTNYNLDSGFTLYYMAINSGSLVSMSLTPVISQYFGWHAGFALCCAGLLVAIVNYLLFNKLIEPYGSIPDFKPLVWRHLFFVTLAALMSVGMCYWLLYHQAILTVLLSVGVGILFIFYFIQVYRANSQERRGMMLFIILFLEGIVFFVLYFQLPTSLTLFALRNINHDILGIIPMQPANFQALNPFWIMVMSPILASIYHRLGKKGKDLAMPTKFALGLFLCGLGFLSLPLGATFAQHGIVSSMWVVTAYFFQSTGELFVNALGLSLVARYVPQRLVGYTMGLWFLCAALASIIGGRLASVASVPKNLSHDPVASLPIYSALFLKIGLVTIGIAFVFALLVPMLKKLTRGFA